MQSFIASYIFAFFSVFPLGCFNYFGDHSLECIQSLWIDVGCLEIGKEYPNNKSIYGSLTRSNIRYDYYALLLCSCGYD